LYFSRLKSLLKTPFSYQKHPNFPIFPSKTPIFPIKNAHFFAHFPIKIPQEIVIYEDESQKPEVGSGLNKTARVLLRKCVDFGPKNTENGQKSPQNGSKMAENGSKSAEMDDFTYEKAVRRIQRATLRMGAVFIGLSRAGE
jgi:hypothetical protein